MPPAIRLVRERPTFSAYLCEPDATVGTGSLLRQRDAVGRAAAELGGEIASWRVDSGRRFPGQRCGDAALRLLAELGRGDVLLVESLDVLGADREVVDVVAGALAVLGVTVVAAGARNEARPAPPIRPERRRGAGHLRVVAS